MTKVSVIVPTYRSGPELDRLVDSLDAQTMPHEDFEVVFVDDGSPDSTYDRLLAIARTRPWVRVHRIEPSGWPSRPRNLAVGWAGGDYVLFADHDDTLFPDGLRAAYEFARAHDVDVVNPKEVRTDRPAWGLGVYDTNHVYARDDAPAEALSPWTPHKLYRRALLLDHGIRFPERAHHMWEDNLFNLDVFVAARTIGVLADTAVYHWQRGHRTSSSTYGQNLAEYWDAVDLVTGHIVRRFDEPALRTTRDQMIAKRISLRVLGQLYGHYLTKSGNDQAYIFGRARRTVDTFFPPEQDHLLAPRHRAPLDALRADRRDLLAALVEHDATVAARPIAGAVTWSGRGLTVSGSTPWTADGDAPLRFRRTEVDGSRRLVRLLPPELEPTDQAGVDWTAAVAGATVELLVRHRTERVSWRVPTTTSPRVVDHEDGTSTVVLDWSGLLDVAIAACGRPLDDGVWDVVAEVSLGGFYSRFGLWATFASTPALLDGRPVLAYSNAHGRLSVDVGQTTVPLAARAGLRWKAVRSSVHDDGSVSFRVPARRVHAVGRAELRGLLELEPVPVARTGWRGALSRWSIGRLGAHRPRDRAAVRLVSDDAGVHLDGTLVPPHRPATVRLSFSGRTYDPHREVQPSDDVLRFDEAPPAS